MLEDARIDGQCYLFTPSHHAASRERAAGEKLCLTAANLISNPLCVSDPTMHRCLVSAPQVYIVRQSRSWTRSLQGFQGYSQARRASQIPTKCHLHLTRSHDASERAPSCELMGKVLGTSNDWLPVSPAQTRRYLDKPRPLVKARPGHLASRRNNIRVCCLAGLSVTCANNARLGPLSS